MFFPEKEIEKNFKILVVDDDPIIRETLSEILKSEGYYVETVENGQAALNKILNLNFQPDVILSDYVMPEMDGITLCKIIKNNTELFNIGVIIITGVNDLETRVKGLEAGADEFLSKPVIIPELLVRIKNLTKIKLYHDLEKEYQRRLEEEVEKKTSELLKAKLQLEVAYEEIKELSLEVIYRLAKASEYRDEHTGYHIQRVAHYAVAIGVHLDLPTQALEALKYGSPLHDIGKLGIPDSILLKPGALSPKEWEIMKMHTLIGAEILSESKIPYLRAASKIAQYHHEKWDGTGYPEGLIGERIPLLARITALADVFDALTTDRPYRKALSIETALEIIKEGKGKHFDPELVDIFFKIKEEILEIKEIFKDTNEEAHIFKLVRKLKEDL